MMASDFGLLKGSAPARPLKRITITLAAPVSTLARLKHSSRASTCSFMLRHGLVEFHCVRSLVREVYKKRRREQDVP